MGQLSLFGDDLPTLREQWSNDAKLKLNSTVAPEDAPRLSAALQRLRDHMADGSWHTGPSLIPVTGLRYGARLEELKRAGLPFEREHVSEGVWRYRLIRGTPKASENAS